MQLNELKEALAKIRKGAIVKVHYQTIKGEYKKETNGVVRLVEYANISGVQVKNKPNPNETHIGDNIIYNANTQKYYIQLATIKTPYKSKVQYFHNGNEITKEEFEQANPPRKSNGELVVFRKAIEDIISIGA